MENVNKIQIRIDTITSSASTISIPFGLNFFPVDNTELQKTEFVDKEVENAINPIVDHEHYTFFPVSSGTIISDIYQINYNLVDLNGSPLSIDIMGYSDDDIKYRRNPFNLTYLRLSFFDTNDSKTQYLVARETIHIHSNNNWYLNNNLIPQSTIPLSFVVNDEKLFGGNNGEGYKFYWLKENLPKTLYLKISLMNAKTGKVINLFHDDTPNSMITNIDVIQGKKDYIECTFFEDPNRIQQYYYSINGGIPAINSSNLINNKLNLNLKIIP